MMNIQPIVLVAIILAVLILAGLILWLATMRMRSYILKNKFGPEYDYTLDKMGNRRTAEADLQERQKRVTKLDLHDLNDHERDRYHREWIEIQSNFVDDPAKSVEQANRLITEVMIARGFPVADFEQRAADLSVLYPNFVPNYREANVIVSRIHERNVSTEELRKAMVNFHSLFDQLLGTVHPVKQVEEPEKEKEMEAS